MPTRSLRSDTGVHCFLAGSSRAVAAGTGRLCATAAPKEAFPNIPRNSRLSIGSTIISFRYNEEPELHLSDRSPRFVHDFFFLVHLLECGTDAGIPSTHDRRFSEKPSVTSGHRSATFLDRDLRNVRRDPMFMENPCSGNGCRKVGFNPHLCLGTSWHECSPGELAPWASPFNAKSQTWVCM
jgi:hypothetical protein